MKKCLLLTNVSSGNAKKSKSIKLQNKLRSLYDIVDEVWVGEDIENPTAIPKCGEYDALCISGGDGTLNWAINAVKDTKICCGNRHVYSDKLCPEVKKEKILQKACVLALCTERIPRTL